jgi:hypothetical protein
MNAAGLTLLLPDKPDVERDALADVWERLEGSVMRLGRFWDPPALDGIAPGPGLLMRQAILRWPSWKCLCT